jgi:voltage-gated potassium channel
MTLARWEKATEWPLTALAVLFLLAYAAPIVDPEAPRLLLDACDLLTWIAWGAFAIDYLIRLTLAPRRWQFIKRHPIDLAAVVLPLLRPLRLIRLLSLLSILNRTASAKARGRVVSYTIASTLLAILVGALAITDAERGQPGASITSFSDGLWWAITTITTVGYGDRYPVTVEGKFIAVALMLCGIALLGVVSASLASWLVEQIKETTESEEAATRRQVEALGRELAEIKSHLAALARDTPAALTEDLAARLQVDADTATES